MALVDEYLAKVKGGRTVINVTHNLQSLRDYGRIIVLEKGRKINEEVSAFSKLSFNNFVSVGEQ